MTDISAPPQPASTMTLDAMIHFPEGLLGFPGELNYQLAEGPGSGLYWLIPSSGPAAPFLLSDPFTYFDGYTLELSQEHVRRIDAEEASDVVVLAVTVPNASDAWTANLQGPIVINVDKAVGAQLVLPGDSEGLRRAFAPELGPALGVAV
ncbi:MAG: flagellar assembly protein FliW [Gemmatimonadota bacterium]